MSDQNTGKLNLLLAELGDTRLRSSRWLRAHGYSNSLVAGYVGSGWLVWPERGVYMRKGGRLQWEGVVRSLKVGEGMPLHVGGRFALSLQGHEHYLRLGDAGTITLYGPERPPGWLGKLPLEQRFEFLGRGGVRSSALVARIVGVREDDVRARAGLAYCCPGHRCPQLLHTPSGPARY